MDTERVQPNEDEAGLDDNEAGLDSLHGDSEYEIIATEAVPEGKASDSDPDLDDDFEDEDVQDRHEEDDDQERALGGSYPEAPPADLEALVHYVVSKLVSDPEAIEISSEQRGGTMYIALRVPESDLGRVIGREGRTAKAIRTLVSIAGSKSNVHARLDIDG